MHRTLLLPALAAAALLAVPADAQRTIRLGETVTGALEAGDPTLDDGSHYDLYAYQGRPGERLRITLESADFDAYLAFGPLEGGELEAQETDDDGAGGTDARLLVTVGEAGRYGIRVNSLSDGETGSYTLRVEAGPAPAPAQRREIRPGQTVQGTLDESDATAEDDSYYELWTYRGPPGRTITITMRSDDVDAFLAWGRISGGDFEEVESDDDGAGGTDARIVVTPGSGEFVIRANTLSEGETGAYTLSIEEGGTPSDDDDDDAGEDVDFSRITPRPIRAGQTVEGALTDSDPTLADDSHFHLYAYTGRAGERITVTLRSDDFDSFLSVGRLDGTAFDGIETDDDGAGGTDAQVEVTLPSSGVFLIRVNTLSEGETGRYTLSVARG